jgi:hypothetical protein
VSFKEELDTLRQQRRSQIPPEHLAVIDGAIEELTRLGITQQCLKVGDLAPDFELLNAGGKPVKLSELLNRGPVVLNFYRGGW